MMGSIKKIGVKIINYFKRDKTIFAKGICFEKLLFIFIIGSIFGTYYEQLLNLFVCYFKDGSIVWESRRGLIYGPLSPIYGAGFILMVFFLGRKQYKWYEILLYGALIGGGFEYLISFLQEKFIGTVSWDYSSYPLNIGGRTTIPYMFFWGALCFLAVKKIYPFLSNLIEKIPYNLGKLLTNILVVFLAINMFLSWGALIRQSLRRAGIKAYTPVGNFFDKYYTDEYLKRFYANMKESDS